MHVSGDFVFLFTPDIMSLLNYEKAIRTRKNGQNSTLMVQYLRSEKNIHGGATYAHLKYFSKPKKGPIDSIDRVVGAMLTILGSDQHTFRLLLQRAAN